MELDELKILFKEKMSGKHATKSEDDILLILAGKTHSVIGKLKRSLRIELVACVIFTVGCVAVALLAVPVWLKIYFFVFAILCALFFPVLWFLLQKTRKLSNGILPVKTNLELIIKILNEYVKRYFQLTMLLIPVSLLVAILLIYIDAHFNGRANPLMQLDTK